MIDIGLLEILLTVAFLIGVALIPLIAYTVGPMLPDFLAEPVANILLMLGFSGPGNKLLVYDEDQSYDIEHVDGDEMGPRRYWSRLGMSTFGVGYRACEDVFGHLAKDLKFDAFEDTITPTKAANPAADRGGEKSYLDTSRAAKQADIHVPTGEKLSQLAGSAGLDSTQTAKTAAMQEHGGDTSGHSPKIRLAGMVIFAIMGIIMGYVVFF